MGVKGMLFKMSTSPAPREIAPRKFRGTASTTGLDREMDHVLSWDVAEYSQNPVLLLGHDANKAIGKVTEISDSGNILGIVFELLPEGASAVADEAYAALRHGTLRGLSIGFLPVGKPARNAQGGFDYTRVSVFEISLVAVQANAEALAAQLGGKRHAPVVLRLREKPALIVDGVQFSREGVRALIQACLPKPQRTEGELRAFAAQEFHRQLCRGMGRLDF